MEREDVKPSGYHDEDRYFHQKELDLLKKKRAQLDAARKVTEDEARKQAHWMKCPKCGADLQEIEMDRIKVDKCTECQGIFFDKGEVELMIEVQKGGMFKGLRKLFGD